MDKNMKTIEIGLKAKSEKEFRRISTLWIEQRKDYLSNISAGVSEHFDQVVIETAWGPDDGLLLLKEAGEGIEESKKNLDAKKRKYLDIASTIHGTQTVIESAVVIRLNI